MSKWDLRFLELACLVASWSKDPSTRVGACVVDDKQRVISVGYNGPPRGVMEITGEQRERKILRTIHAESNALFFAHRDVEGFTMYVTHPCCANCAAVVIQRGIKRVVCKKPSADFLSRWGESYKETLAMFEEAGVIYDEFDSQLYTV